MQFLEAQSLKQKAESSFLGNSNSFNDRMF